MKKEEPPIAIPLPERCHICDNELVNGNCKRCTEKLCKPLPEANDPYVEDLSEMNEAANNLPQATKDKILAYVEQTNKVKEDDWPIQCSLDEQQCREDCKYKNSKREDCPFASRLPYKKEFEEYFKKYYPHLIPVKEPDCSKHPKELFGESDMKKVAEAIGDLHYETLHKLLCELEDKFRKDAQKDYERGRHNLSDKLLLAAETIEEVIEYVGQAWVISKPFMDNKPSNT